MGTADQVHGRLCRREEECGVGRGVGDREDRGKGQGGRVRCYGAELLRCELGELAGSLVDGRN